LADLVPAGGAGGSFFLAVVLERFVVDIATHSFELGPDVGP
jgi:hypothetical protein